MKNEYYQLRTAYGMGHTRRNRIIALAEGHPGQRVLDIGCADGTLGALLKERGSWVGGVELSQSAVERARQRLDAVWSFDIEQPWPSELRQMPFDIIIFGEVLEHVFNPVAVLRQACGVLKSDGAIIITTPNFMTWTNRLRFLFGSFRYAKEGMFDFGHIRWFTYRYLKEVLAQSGFVITDERHIIFPGKLTAALKRWPSLFARQFVVRARKL